MSSDTAKILSIFSLIAGIVGVILSFIPFAVYVGIPVSTAAIVLSALSLNAIAKGAEASKGLAVGGLVCGICGVVFGVPMCLCSAVCQSALTNPDLY